MESKLRGFAIRFDSLGDFLLTQGIYLDAPAVDELAYRYTGNDLALRTQKVFLSFQELEELLEQSRQLELRQNGSVLCGADEQPIMATPSCFLQSKGSRARSVKKNKMRLAVRTPNRSSSKRPTSTCLHKRGSKCFANQLSHQKTWGKYLDIESGEISSQKSILKSSSRFSKGCTNILDAVDKGAERKLEFSDIERSTYR